MTRLGGGEFYKAVMVCPAHFPAIYNFVVSCKVSRVKDVGVGDEGHAFKHDAYIRLPYYRKRGVGVSEAGMSVGEDERMLKSVRRKLIVFC